MRPPKHNAHISLVGTILIMWLMVGYVYLLNPPEPVNTSGWEQATMEIPTQAGELSPLAMSDERNNLRLTLELEKDRFLAAEPVVVIARLSGSDYLQHRAALASLLIENGTQILGPLTFIERPDSCDFIVHILHNPATGLPLPAGKYKVVVQAGADLVAAVSFEVAASANHLAYQH